MHLVFSRSLLSCYWCLLAPTCCRRTSKACGKLGATHPPKDGELSLSTATNGSIPDFLYWLVVNSSLLRFLGTNILVSFRTILNLNIKVTKISYHSFFLSFLSFFLSFFLSLVLTTQPNHWTKRMVNPINRLLGPKRSRRVCMYRLLDWG